MGRLKEGVPAPLCARVTRPPAPPVTVARTGIAAGECRTLDTGSGAWAMESSGRNGSECRKNATSGADCVRDCVLFDRLSA